MKCLRISKTLFAAVLGTSGVVTAFGLPGSPSPTKALLKGLGNAAAPLIPRGGASIRNPSPLVEPIDICGQQRQGVALKSEPAGARSAALRVTGGSRAGLAGIDVPLMMYFLLWYVGNYYYNITNKLCLKAAGGASGFPMTISSLQLGIGCIYGIFLWLAPDAREKPSITLDDLINMIPVAFCYAGAHCASVFSFSAGSVSFGQIVKASEPAFAAVLSQFVYGTKVSRAKWLCLPIVIGGVILASVNELDFAMSALVSACLANMFAAVRGNENKKLMSTAGIQDRLGSVGNQFAITSILGFLFTIPFVMLREGKRWGEFVEIFKTNPAVSQNLIASGLWFYGYNELSTMTLKKTSAVTQSVANTAKRVIVIVGVALVLGESLDPMKMVGCGIGVGGVFLYSIIDQLVIASQK